MWIRLKNIQLYGYHGVHEYEREHGGRFEIDVELRADLSAAVLFDNLNDTIDYVKVTQTVVEISASKKYLLLESFADAMARALLNQFPAEEVFVRVRKPGAALSAVLDTVEIECRKVRDEE